MGRNNKSLNYQLHQRMEAMKRFGESKHEAKREYREHQEIHGESWNPAKATGIFSHGTYEAYKQTSKEFADWMKERHPEVRKLDDISKDHCKSYLKERQGRGLSSWTTSKDMAALNKILNLGMTKQDVGLEKRSLGDITRSRGECKHDARVDLERYKDQITMAQGTGMRRQSMLKVTPSDFKRDASGTVTTVHLKEKGGRERDATILESHRQSITDIVNAHTDAHTPIFGEYDKHIDNHAFRAEYAEARYQELIEAKGYDEGDYRGYDREAIRQVSDDLGHGRLSVVVEHYL